LGVNVGLLILMAHNLTTVASRIKVNTQC